MGIVLDTSVLIAGERRGEGVQAIIQRVLTTHGEQDAALSVVTLVELTHGIYRARTDADRERRRAFTQELPRRWQPIRGQTAAERPPLSTIPSAGGFRRVALWE